MSSLFIPTLLVVGVYSAISLSRIWYQGKQTTCTSRAPAALRHCLSDLLFLHHFFLGVLLLFTRLCRPNPPTRDLASCFLRTICSVFSFFPCGIQVSLFCVVHFLNSSVYLEFNRRFLFLWVHQACTYEFTPFKHTPHINEQV